MVAEQAARVWVNGERVDGRAALPALDHGVSVGDGVFEACKILDSEAFALSRHHRRLARSLAGLGLPPADLDLIGAGIKDVLSGEPIGYGRLRYVVTGGPGPLGSDRTGTDSTYIVTAAPTPRPPKDGRLVVVLWTRNERAATAGLKTTSYADNVIALAYAQQRGGVEAIFANTRGELCECTGSNVFVVRDGVALTPPLGDGALGGITRELVLEWCAQDDIPVREQVLPIGALHTGDEVFITSSTKDVLPVSGIDDGANRTDLAVPGPLTRAVADCFARHSAETMDP